MFDLFVVFDYDNFEVLVIDNNIKNLDVWKLVQVYCEKLGLCFCFFYLELWLGFKVGVLNFGLKEIDLCVDVVVVIDVDYEVCYDWLFSFIGYFYDLKVVVVQCLQVYCDFEYNCFCCMIVWEFDGFFCIGMYYCNECNVIIQYGIMIMVWCLVFEGIGGWLEWIICEDVELGLCLMYVGYELVYVDELMGKGLIFVDFKVYKSQCYCWVFGVMQIFKGCWSWMVKKGLLLLGQCFYFFIGWFSWFVDVLYLIFILMVLFWIVGMVVFLQYFVLLMQLFLILVIGFFFVKVIFGIVLYCVCVLCSWYDMLMVLLVSMSLSYVIVCGILYGLICEKILFVVIVKSCWLGELGFVVFVLVCEELLMVFVLVCCIIGMVLFYGMCYIEGMLWMFIFGVQLILYFLVVIGVWIVYKVGDKVG